MRSMKPNTPNTTKLGLDNYLLTYERYSIVLQFISNYVFDTTLQSRVWVIAYTQQVIEDITITFTTKQQRQETLAVSVPYSLSGLRTDHFGTLTVFLIVVVLLRDWSLGCRRR